MEKSMRQIIHKEIDKDSVTEKQLWLGLGTTREELRDIQFQ